MIKKYDTELTARGFSRDHIRIYGLAFQGKEALIDGGFIQVYEQRNI